MAHYRKQVLSILLTNRCNMKCSYCYLGNDDEHLDVERAISLPFAKKGIDDFFAQFDGRAIRFYAAGEPTREMNLMKEIHSYAESKANGRLTVELQTNGVFPASAAAWIAGNVNIVWISYDGMPEFQDLYRRSKHHRTKEGKPTSHVVERNIRRLLESSEGIVGVRATIGSHNVNRQKDIVDYIHGMGIRVLMVDPMFEPVRSEGKTVGSVAALKVDSMDFARNYLAAWERAKELGIFYGSSLTWNFDEPTQYACRACLPCPHLTPDGYVSACDMASSGDSPLREFIYGVYDPVEDTIVYDEEKIEGLRARTAENMIDCQGCEVLYNCAGGCLGESLNETGSLFHVKKEYCDAIRFLARHMPLNSGLYPYLHP